MSKKQIEITLDKNQAIVLLDWIASLSDNNVKNDSAEQMIFWDIECQLEEQLTAPFKTNYLEIVKQARKTLEAQSISRKE